MTEIHNEASPPETPSSIALKKAIDWAGSGNKLAKLVGCSQNSIWAAGKANVVTGELAVAIEKGTNGFVKRGDFRPDLWPPEKDKTDV